MRWQLREAFEILSDPVQRRQYDASYQPTLDFGSFKTADWVNLLMEVSHWHEEKPTGEEEHARRYQQECDAFRKKLDPLEQEWKTISQTRDHEEDMLSANRNSMAALRAAEKEYIAAEEARQSGVESAQDAMLSADQKAERECEAIQRKLAMLALQVHIADAEAKIQALNRDWIRAGTALHAVQAEASCAGFSYAMETAKFEKKQKEKTKRQEEELKRQEAEEAERQGEAGDAETAGGMAGNA